MQSEAGLVQVTAWLMIVWLMVSLLGRVINLKILLAYFKRRVTFQ